MFRGWSLEFRVSSLGLNPKLEGLLAGNKGGRGAEVGGGGCFQ